ncbi:MAG: methyl-accepting chemotaxis (MCP) signaling domain-containing protein [Hyphomonadaceae bacterium]|nr:MAG: methyl-accepting chemotaxis (MCP) signaling domain-containing protein [Hyphomonadaceae bacterium]KAF0186414.1 MAG: methyl-accepting chemotaxis (MCP) signaling domain-containing protein [Hyphomonadaceae bacterium]
MTASSSLSQLKISFAIAAICAGFAIVGTALQQSALTWLGLIVGLGAIIFSFVLLQKLISGIKIISATCEQAAKGDLEPRIILLGDGGELSQLGDSVNHVLDMSDAFVREAKAAFGAVQSGNFHRRIIERGILGTYGQAAKTVNMALSAMDNRFTQFGELVKGAEITTEEVLGRFIVASSSLSSDSTQMIEANNHAETGVSVIGESAVATTTDAHFVAKSADNLSDTSSQIDDSLNLSRELNESASVQVSETRSAMNQLEVATNEIAPIAEIIRKVAGQTRLLALNASIEAVRAGEHGAAFAVVANEVKSLADQTAKASDDIVERIQTIEQTAHKANETIESFVATVEELTQISQTISIAVVNQLKSSKDISEAIHQTANRSDEVAQNVNTVLAAIKQTSAQATNVNSSAQKLGDDAGHLNQELREFLQSARKIVGRG